MSHWSTIICNWVNRTPPKITNMRRSIRYLKRGQSNNGVIHNVYRNHHRCPRPTKSRYWSSTTITNWTGQRCDDLHGSFSLFKFHLLKWQLDSTSIRQIDHEYPMERTYGNDKEMIYAYVSVIVNEPNGYERIHWYWLDPNAGRLCRN